MKDDKSDPALLLKFLHKSHLMGVDVLEWET